MIASIVANVKAFVATIWWLVSWLAYITGLALFAAMIAVYFAGGFDKP